MTENVYTADNRARTCTNTFELVELENGFATQTIAYDLRLSQSYDIQ